MGRLLFLTLFISQVFIYVRPICKPLDDVGFMGIFGKIYIREQYCTDSNFSEVRNYIANRINNDGLMRIENSDIGSIKTELVQNSKANQIITFTCINCNIKNIEKEGLKKLVKLYNLTLYGNDIDDFDGTFIKNDNMRFQYLNLTNNNIKKVENLCLGLPTIKTIVLRDNPIENLNEHIFKDCKNLQYLDISNTSIKLTNNMLIANTNLTELYLQNISLSNIENIYINIPNLIALDISNNGLDSFDTKLFEFFTSLRILKLNHNNISSIIYKSKVTSFPLRQLFVSNNKLSNISMINLEYFKEIQTLDISFNKITVIPVHFFEHSPDLRHLILNNNQLKKLPLGVFSPTSNIVHLDLSYNNFTGFDEHLLYSLASLEEFYISGNNITSFEPYTMGSMVSTLKRLGISNLKWSCESLTYFIRFCKSHNIDCKPREQSNFQSANVQGITCNESKPEEKSYIKMYDRGLSEEFLNLTQNNLFQQLSLYKVHINEISSIHGILIILTLFAMIFVTYKVITPLCVTMYNRFRTKRELLDSVHLNVSNMELVHNQTYGINA